MKKHLFLLALALLAGIRTASASSGTCGENLTWELNDGVLTIDGIGAMSDYSNYTSVPWYAKHTSINTVIITSRVTSIGN